MGNFNQFCYFALYFPPKRLLCSLPGYLGNGEHGRARNAITISVSLHGVVSRCRAEILLTRSVARDSVRCRRGVQRQAGLRVQSREVLSDMLSPMFHLIPHAILPIWEVRFWAVKGICRRNWRQNWRQMRLSCLRLRLNSEITRRASMKVEFV